MTKKIERVSLSGTGTNRPRTSTVSAPQDPISRMAMKVSVFDIEPYHRNPRTVTNEYYKEIKESIRQKGLEQSFSITRRPDDLTYTIRAGGNTRLRALRELYIETKDPKYLMVDVFFEPYTKEQDLLISHLTENDLRSHLTLLDRAKGVSEARELIESESGRKLSNRELSEALKANGYSLGHTVIGILVYALDEIYPVIPELLEEGAGKPVIERIRKIENQLKSVWKELDQDQNGFKPVFNESLKEALEFSKTGMDSDELFRAFETEMALETGIEINKIRLTIADVSEFKPVKPESKVVGKKEDKEPEFELVQEPLESSENVEKINPTEKEPALSSSKEEEGVPPPSSLTPENVEALADELLNSHSSDKEHEADVTTYQESDVKLVEDIDLLRQIILEQAILVAEDTSISDLVIKVNRGYGFALADMPQEIHFLNGIDETHPDFQKAWQVWYQLYTLCGATLDPDVTHYADFIPYENDLKALLNLNFEKISDLGLYITTAALRSNLFISSGPHLFNQINRLIELIRQLDDSAKIQGINVWEVSCGQS